MEKGKSLLLLYVTRDRKRKATWDERDEGAYKKVLPVHGLSVKGELGSTAAAAAAFSLPVEGGATGALMGSSFRLSVRLPLLLPALLLMLLLVLPPLTTRRVFRGLGGVPKLARSDGSRSLERGRRTPTFFCCGWSYRSDFGDLAAGAGLEANDWTAFFGAAGEGFSSVVASEAGLS